MNILGIDWGEKRIGLACADALGLAVPIKAATQANVKKRLAYIGALIADRNIEEIVIGYPLNMNGTVGFKAREVDQFIDRLDKRFHLPVHKVDERLTSHAVEEALKQMDKKVDVKSGEIDSRAACIILQDFIDQQAY